MMRFSILLILLFPAIAFNASAVLAAASAENDPWYEVELIVFEHVGTRNDQESDEFDTPIQGIELVPAVSATPDTPAAESASRQPTFSMLKDSEMRLRSPMQRLKASPRYKPLLHIGWRQPATAAAGFPGVRLPAGAPGNSSGSAENLSARNGDAGSAPQALEGLVRLSRGRFLNLGVDLRLRQPAEPARGLFSRQAEPDRVFRLQQARRVRRGELNYFDHPRFGAIVLITPYDNAGARATGLSQP